MSNLDATCFPLFPPLAFGQMESVIKWDNTFSTVLSEAVESGNGDTVEAVVAALQKTLTPAEVMVDELHKCLLPSILYRVVLWRALSDP